ncbi:MAG: serine hydrolase domain-containing protein [Novosphingobium sp.]
MRTTKICLLIALAVSTAQVSADTPPLDAGQSDPLRMGWMQGNPPPASKVIRVEDGSSWTFPQSRWAFAHFRELYPTAAVSRGRGPVTPLPVALRPDLAAISITWPGQDQPVNWVEAFDANYADAILVLHRGRIVFEKYNGVMTTDQPHIGFSVTKSLYGMLTEMLIAEGRIDERRTVASYIPELAQSGFADATVRQVLDMTTSLDFNEDTDEGNRRFAAMLVADGLQPHAVDYAGPLTLFDALKTVRKVGAHGQRFDYQSVDTEILSLIIARVTGKPSHEILSERIWSKLGADHDANIVVDRAGMPVALGGLSATLRDFARFGEMMRRGGRFNGQQVVPAGVVARIRAGGNPADMTNALTDYKTRRGWSYRSQWWVRHNPHGAYMAIGSYGQGIYVDPVAEMVVVRFMSGPTVSSVGMDPMTHAAFDALASKLMAPKGKSPQK